MRLLTEKLKFISKVFGQYELQYTESNVSVKCPLCPGYQSKGKKKFVIRLEDNYCHCWVCGYGSKSLEDIIKKQYRDYLNEYYEKYHIGFKKSRDYNKEVEEPKKEIKLPSDFQLIMTCNDWKSKKIRAYCHDRGIFDSDLWLYKIGQSNEKRWRRKLIIPSFDKDGILNDYVGRSFDGSMPKYDSPGHDKINNIFNETNINWGKLLILCEGPIDAIKCGVNSVPLLGSSISRKSKLFEKIIYNKTPIAIALDSDMSHKFGKFVSLFNEYDIDVSLVKVPDDPGVMSKKEFAFYLNSAIKPSWNNLIFDRLSKI
jgi:DNA primase